TSDLAQIQAIDGMFEFIGAANDEELPSSSQLHFLKESVATLARPLEEKLRGELRRFATDRIDDPQERIGGARLATKWVSNHFQSIEKELQQYTQTVAIKGAEFRKVITDAAQPSTISDGGRTAETCNKRAVQYFRLRLDQLALAVATHTVRLIVSDAKAI